LKAVKAQPGVEFATPKELREANKEANKANRMERREKGKLAKAQRKLEAASLVNNPDSFAAVIDQG